MGFGSKEPGFVYLVMRSRLLVAFMGVSLASLSHAYLLQAWSKTLPVNNYLADLVVDTAGNTIVLSGSNATVHVKKVSPTGSDLWAASFTDPSGISPRRIAIDAAGSIFAEFVNYGNSTLHLRKMRATDGANQGTLSMPPNVFITPDNSRHVADGANNVYWVATGSDDTTFQPSLIVANVNSSNLPSSTFRTQPLPADSIILEVKPRPGGGILVLTGIPVEPSLGNEQCVSTLYSFGPTGLPKQTFAGYATTFAVVPGSSEVVFAGGRLSTAGYFVRHRVDLDGAAGVSRHQALGTKPAFFRDVHVSKSGFGVAVGGFEEDSGSYANSMIITFAAANLANGGNLKFLTPNVYQMMTSVEGDAYDGVSCVEAFHPDSFKVMEFDAATATLLHTRTYSAQSALADPVHAVNGAGFIAVGLIDRIVGLKPRDLKDIYMGNTTYQGGTNATAIIRMYEPYILDRTVTLSDGGSPYVTIATSKIILANQTQVSATVLTNPVPSTQNITLTAKYGSQTRTFAFTLTP